MNYHFNSKLANRIIDKRIFGESGNKDNSRLQDLCKKERKVATDKVIGDKDSKLPNPKREISMPKFEFENLLIVDVYVHSTPSSVVGYEVDYIINGIAKKELLWLEGYKTKEELKEAIIKYERGKKMKADNKSSEDIINEELHKNYPELKEMLEKEGIIIGDCVTIGDNYLELTYYHAQDVKGIRMDIALNKIPTNKEIIQYIIEDVQNRYKKVKQSNTVLLKQLLDNPRVESITINHERVGETEHTEIQAKLKEGESK